MAPGSVEGAFVALAAASERLIRLVPEIDTQAEALRRRWVANSAAYFARADAAASLEREAA